MQWCEGAWKGCSLSVQYYVFGTITCLAVIMCEVMIGKVTVSMHNLLQVDAVR